MSTRGAVASYPAIADSARNTSKLSRREQDWCRSPVGIVTILANRTSALRIHHKKLGRRSLTRAFEEV